MTDRHIWSSLDPGERALLSQVCGGMDDEEIAAETGVGLSVVRARVGALMAKVGARSRTQLLIDFALSGPFEN